jgi:hypothetical protein
MLNWDLAEELHKFRRRLKEVGWNDDIIASLEEVAYSRTIYEGELPHIQKDRGNYLEYIRNRSHFK